MALAKEVATVIVEAHKKEEEDEERTAIAKEIATVLVEELRKKEEAEVAKILDTEESQKAEPPVEVTKHIEVKSAETEDMEISMEAVEVAIEKTQELEVSLSIEEAKGSDNVDSANDAKVDESQPTRQGTDEAK